MSIDVVTLDPHRDGEAIKTFSRTVWSGTRGDAYWDWLLASPRITGAVAKSADGEIRALVLALRRSYTVEGASVECLETFDWFCRPEDVGSGLGIYVLKHLLRQKLPIVALGAMPEAQALLRRLGFREVSSGWSLWLPLRGAALRARGWSPLVAAGFTVAQTLKRSIAVMKTPAVSTALLPAPVDEQSREGYGSVDEIMRAWLGQAPTGVGVFERLSLTAHARYPSAILRTWNSGGLRYGELLEIYAANGTAAGHLLDAALLTLRDRGCDLVQLSTTRAAIETAARSRGFRVEGRPPLLIHGGDSRLDGLRDVNGLRGDGPFLNTPFS